MINDTFQKYFYTIIDNPLNELSKLKVNDYFKSADDYYKGVYNIYNTLTTNVDYKISVPTWNKIQDGQYTTVVEAVGHNKESITASIEESGTLTIKSVDEYKFDTDYVTPKSFVYKLPILSDMDIDTLSIKVVDGLIIIKISRKKDYVKNVKIS